MKSKIKKSANRFNKNDYSSARLTIEELRAIGDYDDLSDEEAENLIDSMFIYASIVVEAYFKENPNG
jgi:hypothetical protein